MKNKCMSRTSVFIALFVIVPCFAWALGGPDGGVHKGLPPEAIEACKNKVEGTAVEITTPRGDTVKATCKQIDGQLAAVPEGGFRGPKGTPPAEAIEACKDKVEGTAVEITTPRGDTVKATCKQIDGQLAAVPEGGFRGPKGTPPGSVQEGNN